MNLFGTVYSCNAVAPIMKQQRSGKIITISSVAGTAPSADGGYAHYGAAKAAIAHYTRYLAQDLGPFGITVNCIAPGVIATGRILATVIPGSIQSNRDRAELRSNTCLFLPELRLLLGSAANQAAIDRDHRPGHIVGQVGRQELDDFRAILDGPEPP